MNWIVSILFIYLFIYLYFLSIGISVVFAWLLVFFFALFHDRFQFIHFRSHLISFFCFFCGSLKFALLLSHPY